MGKEQNLKILDYTSFVLGLVGMLNWAFVVFGFNLVTFFFQPILTKLIYVFIGFSAVWIFVRTLILKDFLGVL